MRQLAGEEVEEALELAEVAAQGRCERRRVGIGGRLERSHLQLQPVAEPLDTAEHAHGVALGEPAVEQVDVVPDAALDPSTCVDELEREVGRAAACSQPAFPGDRVDTVDDAFLGELRDRGRHTSAV
jgi:hypothetical protein